MIGILLFILVLFAAGLFAAAYLGWLAAGPKRPWVISSVCALAVIIGMVICFWRAGLIAVSILYVSVLALGVALRRIPAAVGIGLAVVVPVVLIGGAYVAFEASDILFETQPRPTEFWNRLASLAPASMPFDPIAILAVAGIGALCAAPFVRSGSRAVAVFIGVVLTLLAGLPFALTILRQHLPAINHDQSVFVAAAAVGGAIAIFIALARR